MLGKALHRARHWRAHHEQPRGGQGAHARRGRPRAHLLQRRRSGVRRRTLRRGGALVRGGADARPATAAALLARAGRAKGVLREQRSFLPCGAPSRTTSSTSSRSRAADAAPRRPKPRPTSKDASPRMGSAAGRRTRAGGEAEGSRYRVFCNDRRAGVDRRRPPSELPYFGDLEPGKHRVRVFAEGYFDGEREVSGDKPIDQPVDLPLTGKAVARHRRARHPGRYPGRRPRRRDPRRSGASSRSRRDRTCSAWRRNGKKPLSQEVNLPRGKPFRFEPRLEASGPARRRVHDARRRRRRDRDRRCLRAPVLGAGGPREEHPERSRVRQHLRGPARGVQPCGSIAATRSGMRRW